MLNFSFHSPTVIHFGKTKMNMLAGELSQRATKVLIVSGQGSVKKNGIYDEVLAHVKKADIPFCELAGIQPNPRLASVYEGITIARRNNVDFVLAVGGGSVIDAAKAIAAGVVYDGDVWDFYRDHSGPPKALPIGTVLTLAATGSEMNGNTVITKEETHEKRACGSPMLIPSFSILNPEYTFSVNAYHTAAGVADIMTHIFESYLAPIPESMVQDSISEALLKTCIYYGPLCLVEPENYDARANIMWASTLALNGLCGKGKISDWCCHAMEHELSGLYDISHGVGLAIILPNLMKVFLSDETLDTFVRYGTNVWGIAADKDPSTIAHDAIEATREFFDSINLPLTLREVGIDDTHFEAIAKTTKKVRGKVGHYTQLTEKQILEILRLSL